MNMIYKLEDEIETPVVKILGVGGGGANALQYMQKHGIVGAEFAICNTDKESLETSKIENRILIGTTLTEGRGSGSKPAVGKLAAEEDIEKIMNFLGNETKLLILIAGLGGGTGTGASPVIAKAAKEKGILTIAIVTTPFTFEGQKRMKSAQYGLKELKANSDSLILIKNDIIKKVHGNQTISQAFMEGDKLSYNVAKAIIEIVTVPGYVNVDFEDVSTIMRDNGLAIVGSAVASGDNRAKRAVDEALNSPFLESESLKNAKHILINITSGKKEVTMEEIFEVIEFVQEEAGHSINIIWGNAFDSTLEDQLSVTVVGTGYDIDVDTGEVEKIEDSLSGLIETGDKNTLSLYFLEEEFTSEEIAELISFLSDLYREEGGDELVIQGFDVYEYESLLIPTY